MAAPVDGRADIDLYEILGLSKGASKGDIKKAYHKVRLVELWSRTNNKLTTETERIVEPSGQGPRRPAR